MTSMDADAADPVVLEYPFRGRWLARNSPARRIPSHGTDLFGVTYAIDFVGVDQHGRSSPITWRTAFATEPAELFVGFGRPRRGQLAAGRRQSALPSSRGRRSGILTAPRQPADRLGLASRIVREP